MLLILFFFCYLLFYLILFLLLPIFSPFVLSSLVPLPLFFSFLRYLKSSSSLCLFSVSSFSPPPFQLFPPLLLLLPLSLLLCLLCFSFLFIFSPSPPFSLGLLFVFHHFLHIILRPVIPFSSRVVFFVLRNHRPLTFSQIFVGFSLCVSFIKLSADPYFNRICIRKDDLHCCRLKTTLTRFALIGIVISRHFYVYLPLLHYMEPL